MLQVTMEQMISIMIIINPLYNFYTSIFLHVQYIKGVPNTSCTCIKNDQQKKKDEQLQRDNKIVQKQLVTCNTINDMS